jgi:hypothetical protein
MTPTPSPIRRELIYFAEDRLLAGEIDFLLSGGAFYLGNEIFFNK